MSAIILPDKWLRQPTGPVEIDWTHPAARALISVGFPTLTFDPITREAWSNYVGDVATVGSAGGVSWQNAANINSSMRLADSAANSTSKAIVVSVVDVSASSGDYSAVSKRVDFGQGWLLMTRFSALKGNNYPTFAFFDGAGWRSTTGTMDIRGTGPRTLVGAYDGTTVRCFVDGIPQGESSHTGSLPDTTATLKVCGDGESVTVGRVSVAYMIDGNKITADAALSRELSLAPWAIFKKKAKILYFPSAGGGGATITPTGLSSSAFGSFSVLAGDRTITFTGKASDEAFGAFTLKARNRIAFTGKASDEAFGSFNVYPGQVFILPNPKTTDEAYGTHSLLSGQKLISPSGKATDEAFGSFIIISGDRILLINGKASDEAFGTHSINALTDTQNVYPSGYFDSAIGAFSLRPDQYIIFEGQEYLEFGQFLLSGSAVVRAMHFFDWVAQQPGLRGSLNDKLYQYLREHGFTGSTPTMLFLWLRSLGYAGNTATMLTSFERDYTTRWH